MLVVYHRNFKKMFRKISASSQDKFYNCLVIFVKTPHHVVLWNHQLSGEWVTCRSINVTGDIRAVYKERDGGVVQFIAIGSHNELYS